MTVQLIDPRLFGELDLFFPSTIEIQEVGTTQDDYNEEEQTWAAVGGLDQIRCAISPVSATRDTEGRELDMTRLYKYRYALLAGAYPQITTGMRVVQGANLWNVLGAETDLSTSITRLLLEQVTL